MTDNEIIKALEYCYADENNCKRCPYMAVDKCHKVHTKDVLDLINRLQAEVNQLDNESSALLADIDFLDRENDKLQAENKRLANGWKADVILTANVKAEAYKECIEKVKDKSTKLNMCNSGVIIKTDYQISGVKLDNILKELVGE